MLIAPKIDLGNYKDQFCLLVENLISHWYISLYPRDNNETVYDLQVLSRSMMVNFQTLTLTTHVSTFSTNALICKSYVQYMEALMMGNNFLGQTFVPSP